MKNSKKKTQKWHPNFKKYMKFIIKHPNYKGMPFLYKNNNEIRWIAARSTEKGKARLEWWDKKRKELKMKKDDAWISKVAKRIHPTREKPCQICGKVMKLDYVYPNKRGGLSPGAMSNAPDRLDGFHSYNLCCRSKFDKGRHKSNLARYGEDRRAYENWAEGDWKAASWLMKVFQKHGLSPDHLGPISLGFQHQPHFRPLSRSANSARNNRMTYSDVLSLLEDERKRNNIVSFHSKFIWDKIKLKIKSDEDALKLSKLMRKNMHFVLSIFAQIAKAGYKNFLIKKFLHPEHAYYSISFSGFDSVTGSYKKMTKKKGTKKQYVNNANRYIRISFDSLKKYQAKNNRRVKLWNNKKVDELLANTLISLKNKREKEAKKILKKIFQILAKEALLEFNKGRA